MRMNWDRKDSTGHVGWISINRASVCVYEDVLQRFREGGDRLEGGREDGRRGQDERLHLSLDDWPYGVPALVHEKNF